MTPRLWTPTTPPTNCWPEAPWEGGGGGGGLYNTAMAAGGSPPPPGVLPTDLCRVSGLGWRCPPMSPYCPSHPPTRTPRPPTANPSLLHPPAPAPTVSHTVPVSALSAPSPSTDMNLECPFCRHRHLLGLVVPRPISRSFTSPPRTGAPPAPTAETPAPRSLVGPHIVPTGQRPSRVYLVPALPGTSNYPAAWRPPAGLPCPGFSSDPLPPVLPFATDDKGTEIWG